MSLTLRRWQTEALSVWSPRRRGIVQVATGAGKSYFALACYAELLRHRPESALLVMVPSLALRDQWQVLLLQWAKSQTEVNPDPSRIRVTVVNSLRHAAPSLPPSETMLVADECHRYATPSNERPLHLPWLATLGLSATPERQFDDGLAAILEPTLGDIIFTYSVKDALQDGILTPFRLENYRVPLTKVESSDLNRLNASLARLYSQGFGPDDERVAQVLRARARLNQQLRSRVPVAVAAIGRSQFSQALVFHESIAFADELATSLSSQGYRVATYHSKMSSTARLKAVRLFLTFQLDVLVACRALDEGLDVPGVDLAVIAASTTSRRQRIQRMGRVLRSFEGKSEARLITLYALDGERRDLEDEAHELAGVSEVRWVTAEIGPN